MEISIRGGFLKGKHLDSVAFKSMDCKALKQARTERAPKLWRRYATGLLCSVAFLFLIMLKPDWLSTFSNNQGSRLPVLEVGNSFTMPMSELKEEPSYRLSREAKDVRQDVLLNSLERDQRLAIPLGLSNRLQIFVYDLPSYFNEDWLEDDRCSSHLFAAEVAIHQRLLHSPVRTLVPADADFFFVPVYVSCNFSTSTGFPSLGHASSSLQSAVHTVSREMPYWNRSGGKDHIFVATHDYGPCFRTMEDVAAAAGIPWFLQNSVILQTFGRVDKHVCQAKQHIQIPPYVPPLFWKQGRRPEKQRRDIWAFFRGKIEIHPKNDSGRIYSRGVRTTIWQKFRRDRRFFVKRTRSSDYLAEMQRSVFCLCPLGWAPWSPRLVESVMSGCVPVIIADKISLPYSHVIDWTKISVTVAERDVGKLGKILENVSRTNLSRIQENLWKEENSRAMLYLDPLSKGDATWQILELLSKKVGKGSDKVFGSF